MFIQTQLFLGAIPNKPIFISSKEQKSMSREIFVDNIFQLHNIPVNKV